MLQRITGFSIERPWLVIGAALLLTALFAAQMPRIRTDTDPENMLEADQEDRVYYDQLKQDFGIRDMIVIGIVDEKGIFRSEALDRVAASIEDILKIDGVVIDDVVSLTTTNNVQSSGGLLEIQPAMNRIPQTDDELLQLRDGIAKNPFLSEKIASADGTALAIYVPIEQKDMSHRISQEISAIFDRSMLPGQQVHVAGLPAAEDTFGHEMFVQMAIVAPIAFIAVMALVFLLFRAWTFLLPLAMTAMFSVVWTMGLLIGTGQPVHIMSSMIPVFLMPIAILDSVHILSEFFDRYRHINDRSTAITEAMTPLYRPMFFTSLTSGVGFASLALAPIPPVRVFGLFVAFGIGAAWLLSITLVPAMLGLAREDRLRRAIPKGDSVRKTRLERLLAPVGRSAFGRARAVLLISVFGVVIGGLGLLRIEVNDNPVKWFRPHHPMRVADQVMNEKFGGTYMADLVLAGTAPDAVKDPDVLSYLNRLQQDLESHPVVGKTSSVADIVKRIHFVLRDNDPEYDRIPDTARAVGQFLFLFESAGSPGDLDDFINRDASKAHVWIQMKAGDNQVMHDVIRHLDAFVAANPLPPGVSLRWSGMTYINMIWQGLMVTGMLKAVLGSFVVVFLLMVLEFRSITLAAFSMLPLTLAIVLSYGIIGWTGKEYDMPIAVCSSLSLGLAVDFAIHYLHRFREHYRESHDIDETARYMFSEPARAIVRNSVVVTLGFLPLVVSTLTPYVTVGIFFAMLMAFSTIVTLMLLSALMKTFASRLWRNRVT